MPPEKTSGSVWVNHRVRSQCDCNGNVTITSCQCYRKRDGSGNGSCAACWYYRKRDGTGNGSCASCHCYRKRDGGGNGSCAPCWCYRKRDGTGNGSCTPCWCYRKRDGGGNGWCSSCVCYRRRHKSSWWRESSEDEPSPTWLYLTVWLVAVLVYINGLNGDFVHDDISAIKTNPDVLATTPILNVFYNDYWGKLMSDPRSHKSYRPFTILTFRWNHSMFGLDPLGFHLMNVLLHSCACLLLTRLLLRLLNLPQGTVLSAGLIFATHPIHTEAVTGLVGRADVLACISFMAAILSYHRAIELDRDNPGDDSSSDDEGTDNNSSDTNCCRKTPNLYEGGSSCSGGALGSSCDAIRRDNNMVTGSTREGVDEGGREDEGGRATTTTTTTAAATATTTARWTWLKWVAVCATISTLCKEHAITCLPICLIWDCILHRKHVYRLVSGRTMTKGVKKLWGRIVCISIMGVMILAMRLWLMRGSSPMFSDQDNPASCSSSRLTRTLTLWYLPAFNSWLVLCPWTLSHDWQVGSIPLITSISDPRNIASILLIAVLAILIRAGCLKKGSEGRAVLLSVALIILPFLPATNLFFTVGFVVAERILYIPSLGYSVIVAVGLSRMGRLRAPGLLLLLVVFSCRTIHRNKDWHNRETLFIAGLRTLPHNAKMHYNFANLQKDLGNTDLAKYHYQEAIRLWPGHSSAHNNLGTLISDVTQAEAHFRMALKAHPQHANAYYNLANLRKQSGRVDEAVLLLEQSIRHDATNRDAVSTLAGLYGDDGRLHDAENLHLTLLHARPSDPIVHNNYAHFLHKLGRREAALVHYEVALGLDPEHRVALLNSAALMTSLQHNAQAERLYKRALSVSWDGEVGESLGKLYLNTGRLEEAAAVFTTVLTHYPQRISSRVWLARVKAQQRSYIESEDILLEVLAGDPSHQEALFQLSLLYTHTNRTHHALSLTHRAAHNCSTPPTMCARLHAHYADLLNDIHDTDAAAQSYRVAVQLEPTLTHAHVNLGALYHTKGDYESAWRHYLTAHGQDPSNTLLLENLDKLRRAQHLHPSLSLPHCLNIASPTTHTSTPGT